VRRRGAIFHAVSTISIKPFGLRLGKRSLGSSHTGSSVGTENTGTSMERLFELLSDRAGCKSHRSDEGSFPVRLLQVGRQLRALGGLAQALGP